MLRIRYCSLDPDSRSTGSGLRFLAGSGSKTLIQITYLLLNSEYYHYYGIPSLHTIPVPMKCCQVRIFFLWKTLLPVWNEMCNEFLTYFTFTYLFSAETALAPGWRLFRLRVLFIGSELLNQAVRRYHQPKYQYASALAVQYFTACCNVPYLLLFSFSPTEPIHLCPVVLFKFSLGLL